MNKTIKNTIITTITVILAVIATLVVCQHKEQEAFEDGYKKAIEDAILVSSNDEGYILNFEGELYNYTF